MAECECNGSNNPLFNIKDIPEYEKTSGDSSYDEELYNSPSSSDDEADYDYINACKHNLIDTLIDLLHDHEIDVNWTDSDGWSGLMWAADNGHYHIVKILLQNDVNINLRNKLGFTAFHYACYHKYVNILQLLIDHNCDINIASSQGLTGLMCACSTNQLNNVLLLLQYNADINALTIRGWNCFTFAFNDGHVNIMKVLIQYNLNLEQSDNFNKTPFMYACSGNYIEIVKLLIDKGCNINHKDDNGNDGVSLLHHDYRVQILDYINKYNQKTKNYHLLKNVLNTGTEILTVDNTTRFFNDDILLRIASFM